MPRYRDQRIDVDVLDVPNEPKVRQDVVASPVAVADPGVLDDGFDGALLRGLTKMNPALSAWADAENSEQRAIAQERMRREEAAETERGLAASTSGVAMPPEATVAYRDGYMLGSGRRSAQFDTAGVRAQWNEARKTGNFDEDKFFTKTLADNIKGIQDPAYLKGYLAVYSHAEAELRNEKRVEDKAAQRNAALENLGVHAVRLAELPGSPVDHVKDRLSYFSEQRSLGMAPDAIWDSYVDAHIARAEATKDVGVLDRVTLPGPDGVHPGMKPDRAMKLLASRERILNEARVAADREVDIQAAQIKSTIDFAIDQDPKSLGDATDIVMANYGREPGKFIKTTAQAAEYLARIQIKQAEAQTVGAIDAQLDGPNGAAYAQTKLGKKAMEGRSNAVWDKVDQADPNSAWQAVTYSLQAYQTKAYVDPHLKGLFAQDVLAKSKDGSLSQSFMLAARAYGAMQDSGSHGLIEASMDANTRAVMANYTHNVTQRKMTPEDAFDAAHASLSPEIKARTEVLKSGAFQKELDKDLVDAQSRGLFHPFTPTSETPGALKYHYETAVRANLEAGMTAEAARTNAMGSMKERMVFTGKEYVVLPNSQEVTQHKAHIEAGLKGWLAEASTAAGNESSTMNFMVSKDGQKFTLMRDNAPVNSVSLEQLVDAAKRQQYGTEADKIGAVALNQRLVAGAVTPAEAHSLRDQLVSMRAKGFINGARFSHLMQLSDHHIHSVAAENAARIDQFRANTGLDKLGPTTAADVQAVANPVMNPTGANPSAKSIALSALKDNKSPAVALTFATEGISLKVVPDPNGKDKMIGAGYNITARKPEAVVSDLQRSGVAPGDVKPVLEGRMEITPAQVIKLTNIVLERESVPQARAAFDGRFGSGAFARLAPNLKASITYLAYNLGNNVAKFPKALDAIQRGDIHTAMEETKTYNNGKLLDRAHALMRAMLKGESHFTDLLNRGI